MKILSRMFSGVLGLIFMFCSCASFDPLGYNKVGAEVVFKEGKQTVVPDFQQNDLVNVSGKVRYLNLESFKCKHPISGEWIGLAKALRDDDEEICLFVVVATYKNKNDYARISELFNYPLQMKSEEIKPKSHDWVDENFNMDNLPEGAEAQYWLGFSGEVSPSIKGGRCYRFKLLSRKGGFYA